MILHPVCPDAGKTWITDIHQGEVTRKSSPSWWILPGFASEVHQINPIKYQSQLPLNQPGWSTRCAKYLLCGQQAQSCGADEPWTTGWSIPKHKRHHLFGIILGSCTEKANFCFQMPSFRVKKLKLTKRRKLSKILLFMDITELCQGPQVSGTTKFHSPGIGELKNGQESRESGYPGFPWHPKLPDTLIWSQKWKSKTNTWVKNQTKYQSHIWRDSRVSGNA